MQQTSSIYVIRILQFASISGLIIAFMFILFKLLERAGTVVGGGIGGLDALTYYTT